MKSGSLIILEGLDFSGKSTQAKLLLDACTAVGYNAVTKREPGSTAVAEQIREVLLHSKNDLDVRVEALLFQAARASLYRNEIIPLVSEQNTNVIMDRSFWSTLAYQSVAGWDNLVTINNFATYGLYPDLTIILDVPVAVARDRMKATRSTLDRIESKSDEYFEEVRQNYLRITREFKNVVMFDGTIPISDLRKMIWSAASSVLR